LPNFCSSAAGIGSEEGGSLMIPTSTIVPRRPCVPRCRFDPDLPPVLGHLPKQGRRREECAERWWS
jgi:hypothetical protein